MAKRYYICNIVGDGREPETAFRPSIADIVDPATGRPAFNYSVLLPSNPDGTPSRPWCLVIASGSRHTLAAIDGIDPLPDYPLDVKVNAMNAATRSAMMARLQARGVDTSELTKADGFRDFVRQLGRELDPAFHEDDFDVAE